MCFERSEVVSDFDVLSQGDAKYAYVAEVRLPCIDDNEYVCVLLDVLSRRMAELNVSCARAQVKRLFPRIVIIITTDPAA